MPPPPQAERPAAEARSRRARACPRRRPIARAGRLEWTLRELQGLCSQDVLFHVLVGILYLLQPVQPEHLDDARRRAEKAS